MAFGLVGLDTLAKIGWAVFGALTAGSAVHARNRYYKARQRQIDAQAIPVRHTASGAPIPVGYGVCNVHGIRVWAGVNNDLPHWVSFDDDSVIGRINAGKSKRENRFQLIQFDLAADEIDGPIDAWVDDFKLVSVEGGTQEEKDRELYNDGSVIVSNGGVANESAIRFTQVGKYPIPAALSNQSWYSRGDGSVSGNGSEERIATDTFDGLSYATLALRFNDDLPKIRSESPSLLVSMRGRRCHTVELKNGVYALSPNRVFTSNLAYVWLDYILSRNFGPDFPSADKLNLKSFYTSAQRADRIVQGQGTDLDQVISNALNEIDDEIPGAGRVTLREILQKHRLKAGQSGIVGQPGSVIRRYEYNGQLDTTLRYADARDRVLAHAPGAHMYRDFNGQWNLSLPDSERTAAEQSVMTITDRHLTGTVKIISPEADDRLNELQCRFASWGHDWAEDTITMPKPNSAAHRNLLAADGNVRLDETRYYFGAHNPYAASCAAANEILISRRDRYILPVNTSAMLLEEGDVIKVESELSDIAADDDVYLMIDDIQTTDDYELSLTCVYFVPSDYAWVTHDVDEWAAKQTATLTPNAPTDVTASVKENALVEVTVEHPANVPADIDGWEIETKLIKDDGTESDWESLAVLQPETSVYRYVDIRGSESEQP